MAIAVTTNRKIPPVEVAALRVVFLERGIRVADFAKACGRSRMDFSAQMSRGFPCRPLRAKVEAVLGWKSPIWSDSKTLARRKRAFQLFGFDPAVELEEFLRAKAPNLGIPLTGRTYRDDVTEAFLDKAACSPLPPQPKN